MTVVSPDGDEEEVLNRMPDQNPGASPERSQVGRELRECILRALARLSPRERLVFELKHYQGIKLRTVADLLDTTEGTIKNPFLRQP
jgi:RNA polymerase sigma-70 factor (ECF subfamily)